METRRRRQLGMLGGVLLLCAGSYALYRLFSKPLKKEHQAGEGQGSYNHKPITIVLTDSIIASKLPINEILMMSTEMVLVIPPELSVHDLNQELDRKVAHKVIECDTFDGVWSVVKHLNSDLIFVVTDDLPDGIPPGLERYVGDIVELDQNLSVINESILSAIVT